MNLVYQNQDMNQSMVASLFACLRDEEESKTRQSILERACFYWDYQIQVNVKDFRLIECNEILHIWSSFVRRM
jgi:hypothetical protein